MTDKRKPGRPKGPPTLLNEVVHINLLQGTKARLAYAARQEGTTSAELIRTGIKQLLADLDIPASNDLDKVA